MSDIAAAATVSPATSPASTSVPSGGGVTLWSHSKLGIFKDILDIINPLQHLPIIGSIYRYLTGDEPSGGARIVGDALYGGPIGFGVGVVSTLLTDSDGRDLGERTLAAVFGPRNGDSEGPVLATPAATTPQTAQAQPVLVQPAQAAQARPVQSRIFPGPIDPTQVAAQTQIGASLYRSPPTPAMASPEQTFLMQNAQFQRQLTNGKSGSGQILNSRPVPLELTGSLPPPNRPISVPSVRPAPLVPATNPAMAPPKEESATNPIAQKMIDALNKYERMKRQQEQDDKANDKAPAGVDLSL